VDISINKHGYSVVGKIGGGPPTVTSSNISPDIRNTFLQLPAALQQICGNVIFPVDNCKALMQQVQQSGNILIEASDASLKDGRAI
jgi:hypothetical protein